MILHSYGRLRIFSRLIRRYEVSRFCTFCSKETELLRHLQAKIKFSGPITVCEYMKEVLTNPLSGYYMNKSVIGHEGDFVTSPEISQMFGELIAIWMYNEWQKMGSPKPFQLIEFGPGTGSLMQDMLRTLKQLKLEKSDFELHLVEKSPSLSNLQEKSLCSSSAYSLDKIPDKITSTYKSSHTTDGIPIHWHYHFSDVPKGFSMILAHEFFDALPIHKLKKTEEGWKEVLVDVDYSEEENGSSNGLRYILSRGPTPASKLYVDSEESRNEIEVSPETGILIVELSARIEDNGGAALIIDYGHDGSARDTFRAFRKHKQVSPLAHPGYSDLTADVDFSYIRKHAQDKLLVYGPVSQSFFLKNMGIEFRLQKLLQNSSEDRNGALISGYKMLVDSEQMGSRFKAMALLPLVMKDALKKYPPAGFYNAATSQE